MRIERQTIVHDGPGGPFEALAVFDADAAGPRPIVLLFPNVLGLKEADFEKAEALAALGYAVFCADVYGQGKRTTRQSLNPAAYMDELNNDRVLMRERLQAAFETARAMPQGDSTRVAAIGFCFGGKCVLDLARSGADFAGGVSFHGVYDPAPQGHGGPIVAKLLVCHGWDDPIAPPEATVALAKELTDAGVDWQLHAYGNTAHAFTDKDADMVERGVYYVESADRRSWRAMVGFLEECFA
ncbi:dienelactone hydrolase family protein [Stakelama tenebrarum]|uniref:Prolyl oligopeptidase family serine peptidase n=1 Tax=Stakelama tenebrarum TaxID=2711215 RepID=A0A6G6Y914_9SPHN|nr:dienelactone hydrolase family protein [Sphingosinithalassobacter tenebrarum]QIG81409.1 prolyl oligopeptidase family serine peptidase [Sphingosinithalassobacter tenebrarum]